MSQKSDVVCLNKLHEMIEIMEDLQQYVPCVEGEKSVLAEGETEPDLLKVEHFHNLLFGGDQLTAARCRGALKI